MYRVSNIPVLKKIPKLFLTEHDDLFLGGDPSTLFDASSMKSWTIELLKAFHSFDPSRIKGFEAIDYQNPKIDIPSNQSTLVFKILSKMSSSLSTALLNSYQGDTQMGKHVLNHITLSLNDDLDNIKLQDLWSIFWNMWIEYNSFYLMELEFVESFIPWLVQIWMTNDIIKEHGMTFAFIPLIGRINYLISLCPSSNTVEGSLEIYFKLLKDKNTSKEERLLYGLIKQGDILEAIGVVYKNAVLHEPIMEFTRGEVNLVKKNVEIFSLCPRPGLQVIFKLGCLLLNLYSLSNKNVNLRHQGYSFTLKLIKTILPIYLTYLDNLYGKKCNYEMLSLLIHTNKIHFDQLFRLLMEYETFITNTIEKYAKKHF